MKDFVYFLFPRVYLTVDDNNIIPFTISLNLCIFYMAKKTRYSCQFFEACKVELQIINRLSINYSDLS